MTSYGVVFAPESEDQLAEPYLYIATRASPATAERYTDAIVSYCESLSTFSHRGARRDDIRPGLRITNYKGRTVVAFDVDDAVLRVSILGVFHGGQDYETALQSERGGRPGAASSASELRDLHQTIGAIGVAFTSGRSRKPRGERKFL